MDGPYTYCFGNQMSTMTPKVVMFSMEIAQPGQPILSEAGQGNGNDSSGRMLLSDYTETDFLADSLKLEEMVRELSSALTSVKHEQEYMEVRERLEFWSRRYLLYPLPFVGANITLLVIALNENTNSRVVLWAIFEAVVLASMTVGQIFYLKRFFEVRRVV
ncbi:unnamed protein product [Wuchereria bancrofti]|uniref:GOLD domain-containing protein n=1 Tax=Wuchereria bancrofti TaxID=6293 RepID=A0A3P7FRJ4_WUCBA|nr:unnamed protein product [Wuchereria bancrofti]